MHIIGAELMLVGALVGGGFSGYTLTWANSQIVMLSWILTVMAIAVVLRFAVVV